MKKTITLFAFLSLFLLAGCDKNKDNNTPDEPDTPTTPTGVRYRGIGTSPDFTREADIKRLAGWGVNHVRWIFDGDHGREEWPLDRYYSWIDECCDSLDARLPLLEELGITVNIALMIPPGGRNESNYMRMFYSYDLQEAFIETWRRIATRYRGNATVVYYDLLNEPSVVDNTLRNLIIKAVEAVSAIDNTKTFIYPTVSDITTLEPLPVDNMIYSEHVYTPHVVTHEGVSSPHGAWAYPGKITGVDANQDGNWNKAFLRLKLSNLIGFANKYGKELYIGEFGCARWAKNKSAYNYLKDCLEIFEEEGWHYAYFCDFPDASQNYGITAWSLQYDDYYRSSQPAKEPTDRLLLLQSYWAKNSE